MRKKKFNKIIRQLAIYQIFYKCRRIEYREITVKIDTSIRTIQRDVRDLSDAGLIDVRFSTSRNAYIHNNSCKPPLYENDQELALRPPVLGGNHARNRHLKKLNRPATIIFLAQNEDIPFYEKLGYPDEDVYEWARDEPEDYLSYNDGFPDSNGNEHRHYVNYIDWYQKTFPDCSRSTMFRDFKVLRQLGLTIGYNNMYRYYELNFDDFYEENLSIFW